MTVRVTATEVKVIISTEQTDTVVDVFISAANLIVTEQLTDSGMSANLLKEIERWLAAHLLTMSLERQARVEQIGGDTREEYSQLGLGLNASTYGQTVKTLDTSGILGNLGKSKATITAVTSFED